MKKFKLLFSLITIVCLFSFHAFAQQGEWTWVKGSNGSNGTAIYGTLGVPDAANTPGAYYEPMEWTDHDGNFWLFGGLKDGGSEYNTMWKFDPSTEEWTWVRGSSSCCQAGNYGTQGIPSATNMPGARAWGAWTWVDNDGYLWLYGGIGEDDAGGYQVLSDLWKYDIANDEWTWMDGPNTGTVDCVYGTLGVSSNTTSPGARAEGNAGWVDDSNRLWLFGGALYFGQLGGWSIGGFGNDMWMWDPDITQWTWMQGTQQLSLGGVYGTKGVPDSSNYPPGRGSYCHWEDPDGNFYFFGGYNLGANWNDMWKYDWQTNVYTWISGPNTSNSLGSFGTKCVTDANNVPPARYENRTFWQDTCGNFWLSSGFSQTNGNYNDLWHYNVLANEWTWIGGSNTSNSTGNYGTLGVSSPTNEPPARGGSVGWRDNDGNLWLFGGMSDFFVGNKNDLWRFVLDPTCPAITSCTVQLPSLSSSDTSLCEKFCVDFFAQSTNNPVTWDWTFEGGSPSTSTEQNPTNICYDDPGDYDVTLIVGDGNGNTDTITLVNFIKVFENPFAPTISQNGNILTSSAASTYQWSLNSVIIPGATDQSYEITESGLYTVSITNENGCNAESSVEAFLVGIDEIDEGLTVNVFANPSSEEIIVSGSSHHNEPVNIQLMNAIGQVVMTMDKTLSSNFKFTMNVAGLSAGTYILEFNTSTTHITRKIILSE